METQVLRVVVSTPLAVGCLLAWVLFRYVRLRRLRRLQAERNERERKVLAVLLDPLRLVSLTLGEAVDLLGDRYQFWMLDYGRCEARWQIGRIEVCAGFDYQGGPITDMQVNMLPR